MLKASHPQDLSDFQMKQAGPFHQASQSCPPEQGLWLLLILKT